MVTLSRYRVRNKKEMTPVKATIVSLLMLSGILMWGAGIYTAGASDNHPAMDGYGITASAD